MTAAKICLGILGAMVSVAVAEFSGYGGGLSEGSYGDYGGDHSFQTLNDHHDHHDHHEDHHHHEPKPYEFGYSVKDHHHGTHFGQKEHSDGHTVKGQYKVHLPDGRVQIVTYHADWKTGFHADVKYEGEAHYPKHVEHPHHEEHHSGGDDNFAGIAYGGYGDHGGYGYVRRR